MEAVPKCPEEHYSSWNESQSPNPAETSCHVNCLLKQCFFGGALTCAHPLNLNPHLWTKAEQACSR